MCTLTFSKHPKTLNYTKKKYHLICFYQQQIVQIEEKISVKNTNVRFHRFQRKNTRRISLLPTKKYISDFIVSNENIYVGFHFFQRKLFFSTSTKLNKEKNPLELTLIM